MSDVTTEERERLEAVIYKAQGCIVPSARVAANAVIAAGWRPQRAEPILTLYKDPPRVEFIMQDGPTISQPWSDEPRVERLLDMSRRALVGVTVYLVDRQRPETPAMDGEK